MEFLHARSDDPTSPIDSIRVNWYYRPRDIQRFNSDSRLLYGTMHSDLCPITALRGKCTIKHRSEIEDLDAYRKERDSFYFVQIFDRFIRRWYECIPVAHIVNVPEKVKKALDERWKFVVVELGRVKELTSAVKNCKRCAKYCASSDSVDCAICKNSYHMNCVQPPLPKKPSRGFAWACGPCSRASERKLEHHNTPSMSGNVTEAEEEELVEEEVPSASNDTTQAPSPTGRDLDDENVPATQAEIASAKLWPMRYLGIHSRVEDALQYDDRAIYPRASSRLGPRHQANVSMWPGRPVELVKPAEIKKRYNTKNPSHKKDGKLTKETIAALEADREERAKRPKWVQDEPPGYVARGEDYDEDDPRCTATLLHRTPEHREQETEEYLKRANPMSRTIGVPPFGTNFLDRALALLTKNRYDQEAALKQLQSTHRIKDLHEPVLNKQELQKFEEGVAKYGSEHRLVRLHMKTNLPNSSIVRFYYLWKKTPKGRDIWGTYGGRKNSKRKADNDTGAQLQQSVANDGDDSAFDSGKASKRGQMFQCKFCHTTHSRQWRRAPGAAPGQTVSSDSKNVKEKAKPVLLALCLRCAGLWRRYAIQWEDIDEVAKKVASGGGRAWKRRIDEELLRELIAANEAANMPDKESGAVPSIEANGEPQKKKAKTDAQGPSELVVKKKEKLPPPPKEPTPPPPPIVPNQPQWRVLPCSICKTSGDTIACAHCSLTVHRQCFGVLENQLTGPDGQDRWVCEQCLNDRNPQVSTDYACCLCLTEETLIDLVEPPKVSHKKKTDREREKERMEKELADSLRNEYRNKQKDLNRPLLPREPLKRTTGNNWVHVYCAVWMPEIRFSDAKAMEVAEGFQSIPPAKHDALCKLCKNKDHQNRYRDDKGACVSCFQCQANIHVSCAFEAGYIFGFDVTPVKGSRKDQITTVKLGDETGSLQAGIWCKEHTVKTIIHPVNEFVDDTGRTALQVFVENYKQADLTLTGTVRKANLAQLTKDKGQQAQQNATNLSRRESTANSIAAAVKRGARTSSIADLKQEAEDGTNQPQDVQDSQSERVCARCKIDVTPRWHIVDSTAKEPTPPNSPPRRLSMTLAEYADYANGRLPATGPARPEEPRNPVNIRFMPPGANGRAWEGMPQRWESRASMHSDPNIAQQSSAGASQTVGDMSAPQINGDSRVSPRMSTPQHSDSVPAMENASGRHEAVPEEPKEITLCHKCFLKKKLDPTPPPEEQPRVSPSPPGQAPVTLGWSSAGQQSFQPSYDHSQPPRMPWDEPTPPVPTEQPPQQAPQPQNSAPPTHPVPAMNGYDHPMPYASHAPAQPSSQPSSYPRYNQPQMNGYYPVPQQAPPAPPLAPHQPQPQQPQPAPSHHNGPSMHERHNSYSYGPPPTSLAPSPYYQQVPPRPSPYPNYIQPQQQNQSMPNDLNSSHTVLHAPVVQSPPNQQHTSAYPNHGPARVEPQQQQQQPPPPSFASHPSSTSMGSPQFARAPEYAPLPRTPQFHPAQPQSPQPVNGSGSHLAQGRPATPRDSQGGQGGGASASPNLRNLLT